MADTKQNDFRNDLRSYMDTPLPDIEGAVRSVAANEEDVRSTVQKIADFGEDIFIKPAARFGELLASRYSKDVADARKVIDGLRETNPELYNELHGIVGDRASFKQVAGAGVETALTALSFVPGVGFVAKGGAALKGAKAAQAFKASKYLRASIEGGFWGAGFFGADAAANDAEVNEIAKAAGVGFLGGAAIAPVATGAFSLTKAGFTKLANIKPAQNIWSGLAETQPVKFVKRFFSRTGKILEKDFNAKNIVDGIKEADRNTLIGMARILDTFENDLPFKVNKRTMNGARAAYEFGRGKVTGEISTKLERGTITGTVKEGAIPAERTAFLKGTPEEVLATGVSERWNAVYQDFAETARALQLNVKSVDPKTGKITWKPFPKAEELTSAYRPKVGADIDRLRNSKDAFGRTNTYRHFAIQQMVDDSTQGISRWKFKNFEDAEKFLDEWIKFIDTNGKGFGKENIMVKGMLASGQAESEKEAIQLLNRYRTNLSKVKLGSYLENERLFDFPIYNPFPDETLLTYSLDSLKRIELVNQFGYKLSKQNQISFPVIDRAVERVRRSFGRGSEEIKQFDKFIKIALERVEKNSPADKFSLFLRTLSIPKLTFAQIINSGQGFLNTLLVTDAPTTIKAIARSFTLAGKKEALRSGATLETVVHEAMRASSGSDFGAWWLKKTGFVFTEWWNRTVAANGFKIWTEKNFSRLLKNPESNFARRSLVELGIDVDRALKRGKLTDFELLKAMQIGAERTQFRSRPVDLPWWSSSPTGKVFWQFKNFVYQQTNLIKDEMSREFKAGNYGRVGRMLLVLGTVFPMTGEVLADVRSLVNQSRRPTDALDRYLQDLAMSGAWGIVGDWMSSGNYDAFEISAPTLGTITDLSNQIIKGGNKAFKGEAPDKEFKNFIIDAMRASGILTPVANVITEKRKGRESTIETIQRLTE